MLIGASALLLTGNPFAWHRSEARHAVGFALLTGFIIAAYTIWDKASVAAFLIPPLVYDWGTNALPLLRARAPHATQRAGRDGRAWREQRGTVVRDRRCSRRFPTSWCSPRWCSRR